MKSTFAKSIIISFAESRCCCISFSRTGAVVVSILPSGLIVRVLPDCSNVVAMVAEILPITALFITPAAMITGYVSLSTGLISLGILVVSIYILMNFVANIYESMVYYNGKPLKIKEIINISKMKKSNKKRGEK